MAAARCLSVSQLGIRRTRPPATASEPFPGSSACLPISLCHSDLSADNGKSLPTLRKIHLIADSYSVNEPTYISRRRPGTTRSYSSASGNCSHSSRPVSPAAINWQPSRPESCERRLLSYSSRLVGLPSQALGSVAIVHADAGPRHRRRPCRTPCGSPAGFRG